MGVGGVGGAIVVMTDVGIVIGVVVVVTVCNATPGAFWEPATWGKDAALRGSTVAVTINKAIPTTMTDRLIASDVIIALPCACDVLPSSLCIVVRVFERAGSWCCIELCLTYSLHALCQSASRRERPGRPVGAICLD